MKYGVKLPYECGTLEILPLELNVILWTTTTTTINNKKYITTKTSGVTNRWVLSKVSYLFSVFCVCVFHFVMVLLFIFHIDTTTFDMVQGFEALIRFANSLSLNWTCYFWLVKYEMNKPNRFNKCWRIYFPKNDTAIKSINDNPNGKFPSQCAFEWAFSLAPLFQSKHCFFLDYRFVSILNALESICAIFEWCWNA